VEKVYPFQMVIRGIPESETYKFRSHAAAVKGDKGLS